MPKGTKVTSDKNVTKLDEDFDGTQTEVYVKTNTAQGALIGNIDSESFEPTTDGLYIFRRTVNLNTAASAEDTKYEFSGYYRLTDGDVTRYYALNYTRHETDTTTPKRSDYTLPKDALELYFDDSNTASSTAGLLISYR